MKRKSWGLVLLSAWMAGNAYTLPLSPQAKEESKLFTEFLEAAYAQRESDPRRFAKLRGVLAHMPQSAYLKQQLVAEALAADSMELADVYADFIEDENAQKDPEAWAVYGAYQWQKGNSEKAVQSYEKALELDPEDESILFQYITVLVTSDPDKAAKTLDTLAKNRPMFAASIYTETGRMYLFHKRYPEALKAFDKAVAQDPSMIEAYLGRAEVYERTKQYFLMLHELEEVDKRGAAQAQILARMGAVYVLAQDLERAEYYFMRAKQAENDNLPAGNFLALLAEQRGEYERAIAFLRETSDYAEDPAKQIQVSYYQRKLNRPQESFETLRQVHRHSPDNNEAAYLYAVALNERKSFKQAARLLAPLTEKFPDNEEVRLQYAFSLEGSKQYAALEEQVKILFEKNPNNAAALNLLAFSLAERGVQLDRAAELSARSLAIWPNDLSLQDTQAWIFYKQGNYPQAAQVIEAMPEEYVRENPEISYHAGMIYRALGEPDKARTLLEQAADGGWKPAKKALKK